MFRDTEPTGQLVSSALDDWARPTFAGHRVLRLVRLSTTDFLLGLVWVRFFCRPRSSSTGAPHSPPIPTWVRSDRPFPCSPEDPQAGPSSRVVAAVCLMTAPPAYLRRSRLRFGRSDRIFRLARVFRAMSLVRGKQSE